MKKVFLILVLLAIMPLAYGFAAFMDEQQWVNWGNKALVESYDPSGEPNIIKWEIMLTTDHFIRLRKTYQQGNQEYYSFNIKRLNSLNYLPGNDLTDTLQVQTKTDDIIIQTYNDPAGDLDSMATTLNIPVKKLVPGRLDSLKQGLSFLRMKGM
ncbi:hypothetical protein IDJ77_23370 [Mucilaginibacter sp. ZT4R22]|uniref:Uncharacterized protein n=1 Tax=Mucilaginibacter pankratovii TaxID=2772110 RepID=A0ABR7WWW0_9SPHI|nr:hypothetical protein [Mucilaginibacter pankratovii]MBD1366771.1 hypothetical protein [Mucilaginibacter pankratovii]